MDAKQVFKNTFNALINEDYSIRIDIERYQCILEYAISKVSFSIGTGIYILQSKLRLNIGKPKRYKYETLMSNIGIKIASNRNINETGVCH